MKRGNRPDAPKDVNTVFSGKIFKPSFHELYFGRVIRGHVEKQTSAFLPPQFPSIKRCIIQSSGSLVPGRDVSGLEPPPPVPLVWISPRSG